MNREQLQDIFRQPYSADKWQELLINLFGASEIRQTPSFLTSDSNEKVEGFELGRLHTSDRYEIGLFAFEIKQGHNLKLNRVGLRSLVRSYTRHNVDAALVVYYDATHWRLSFICDIKDQKTSPKRYTYVFGNTVESYRTAADRLSKLTDTKPNFEQIKDAFSVEKLSKDFFKGYKDQYSKFCKHIGGEQKWQRDYVKKMMGRLVFLQFLQKKGWMGCGATLNDWQGGDLQYTQNLVKRYADSERLLSNILEPLFFDTLNKKRDGDIANPILGDNIKIPYLNGGLFDKDRLDKRQIDFPYSYFADLMEFFSQYNFTIDENDPYDAEVGIDPEMLGHIFENLLEDNKDKGAFYTPKEIVQYMCRQSLIEYLQTKLGKHAEIERFINNHDTGNPLDSKNYIPANANAIEELLDSVKVCDPAIGSGAFPMGILNEIFHAKMALNMTLNRAEVKKNIIQNSIYGVDIEQGAVDIARLRFWLALVVDDNEPQPLPNLDYKIMCGNSLLSRFSLDTPINEVFAQYNKEHKTNFTLESYRQLVQQYTNTTSHDTKAEFRRVIEEIKSAFKTELGNDQKMKRIRLSSKIQTLESVTLFGPPTKENLKEAKELRKSYDKMVQSEQDITSNKLYEDSFEWRFEFPQLLNDNGNFVGFDIVIGNPPYIQLQANGGTLAEQLKEADYETFARTGDIYCLFYERGLQILRDGGIETFITSNKWMRAGYGEKLRKYLAKNNPLLLLDLGSGVFESATVDTNILIIQNGLNKNEFQGATYSARDFSNITLSSMSINSGDIWTILSPLGQSIKRKIESIGTPLRDWDVEIYRGVLTGYNEAFIIDTAKRDELVAADPRSAEIIKPILRGRDIKRYTAQWAGLWLIATFPALKLDIENYPAVRYYLSSFGNRIHQSGEKGSRKKTNNKWFETQDQIGYYEEFEKEKIMYPNISSELGFLFDNTGLFSNDKSFIITGDGTKYLLSILNSKFGKYQVKKLCAKLGNEGYELRKIYMDYFTIPKLVKLHQQPFIEIVDKILESKKADPKADTTALEAQIDSMVYALYNLTPDEIAIIEK